LLQLAPWQRSIRYLLIVPPVSVEATQVRSISVLPTGVVVKAVGAVNVGAGVVTETAVEYGLKLFKASVARAR
jgi:hypothetical protein